MTDNLDRATTRAANECGPFRPAELLATNGYKSKIRDIHGRLTRYFAPATFDLTIAEHLRAHDDSGSLAPWCAALDELADRLGTLDDASPAFREYYAGQYDDYTTAARNFTMAAEEMWARRQIADAEQILDDTRVWFCGVCSRPLDRVEAAVNNLICYGCPQ